jgi:hypothetical protein
MTKEVMKLALETLEDIFGKNKVDVGAINALRQALKQKQDEPVAYINVEQRKLEWAKYTSWETPTVVNLPKIPLYTKPQTKEWVGLTDGEIDALFASDVDFRDVHVFSRAIEAKLKEKNT